MKNTYQIQLTSKHLADQIHGATLLAKTRDWCLPRHHQQGMSLVELMLAITLSLILIAGSIRFYVGNKNANNLQTDVSAMQSDARFAVELMSRDLRMAGSSGCISVDYIRDQLAGNSTRIRNWMINSPVNLAAISSISGWEAAGTDGTDQNAQLANVNLYGSQITGRTAADWIAGGAPPNQAINLAIPNSDILHIMHAGSQQTALTNTTENANGITTDLTVANGAVVNSGDLLLITDCVNVDIVVACTVNGNNIDLADQVSNDSACGAGANEIRNAPNMVVRSNFNTSPVTVSKLVSTIYFIGKPAGGANNSSDFAPGLFRTTNGSPAEQIAENVENMQMLFTDSTGPKAISSFNLRQTSTIRNARVSLLFTTPKKLSRSTIAPTYDMNGLEVTPVKDGRIRRVYNTTVAVRSRI